MTEVRTEQVCQCEDPRVEAYDAIVLAGGRGQRLGGLDKAELEVGSRRLLDRALEAVRGADRVVVVGPARVLPSGVTSISEHPPGGGPVAAIAAAMPCLRSSLVVVLACDMPLVTAATVERLVAASAPAGPREIAAGASTDGTLLVDGAGRRQYLAAIYRVAALTRALSELGSPEGQAMRRVVHRLTVAEVATDPEVTLDCDTWDDVERSRSLLEDP
jgi:molybdopterin-guanine dinucleotide biosynthesis protein A